MVANKDNFNILFTEFMGRGEGKKAIVLLSGGLDSATVLAIASSLGYEVYALSFLYGQRHVVELDFAQKLAAQFKVREHKIASIDLRIFGGSALTSEIAVPKNDGGNYSYNLQKDGVNYMVICLRAKK